MATKVTTKKKTIKAKSVVAAPKVIKAPKVAPKKVEEKIIAKVEVTEKVAPIVSAPVEEPKKTIKKVFSDQNQNSRREQKYEKKPQDEFEAITVETRRVTKVTKGAKRFRFSAIVVVGNRSGRVGVGLGRGKDPKESIDKASKYAKAHLIDVVLNGTTIPHQVIADFGAAKVLLKPASKGTGIIAGSSVRSVLDLAGIKDIRGKIIGSNNKINNVYCTMKALLQLRDKRL